ncbi:MAG: hypothetical protein M1831_001491 [Alyxoria varia]|nr:MAG: hypothetical protein M1831_001491 [Alyxoria varia]
MAKTIAVLGATGAQGGSVVSTFLDTDGWRVRAITRNPSSTSAQALAKRGAEIVSANIDDVSSLLEAFKGANAIFAVTNFWEHLFMGNSSDQAGALEEKQAMNIVEAADKTSGLEHFIWHSLPGASKLTGGKFTCAHLDYKAVVDEKIQSQYKDLAAKTTFFYVGWYPSNMAGLPICKPFPVSVLGGKYIWPLPTPPSAPMPVSGDMNINPGLVARAAIQQPQKTLGKYVDVTTEVMPLGDILKVWSQVTGKEAAFVETTYAGYESMWGPAGAEFADQLKFGETVTDWHAHIAKDFVSCEELGVEGQMVGLKGALEVLLPRLL